MSQPKWNRYTRRHFLKSGSATVVLPLLASLMPEKIYAQSVMQKNFIGISAMNGLFPMYGPNSVLMPATNPANGTISGFTATDIAGKHKIHSKSLIDIKNSSGKISNIIDATYNPYLSKMLMLQGFDFTSCGWNHHTGMMGNMGATVGATSISIPSTASIEHVMAYSLQSSSRSGFYKNATLSGKVVNYSTPQPGGYGTAWTWSNPSSRSTSSIVLAKPYTNPATLWDAFFTSNQIPQTVSNLKKTIVDQVLNDYLSLRSNSKLGKEDKVKLDNHMALLQETQRRVASVGSVCSSLRPATSFADRKMLLRALNDVIVSLIACGKCHSFHGWSYCIASSDAEDYHNWSHQGYNGDTDVVANAAAATSLLEHNRSIMNDMFLDVVTKLDQASLLDNSLVAVVQEHSKRGHQSWNIPVITAGSAGGILKTGQYVDYRDLNSGDDKEFVRFGFPANQLLANFLNALDVTPAEYEAYNPAGAISPVFANNSGYGAALFLDDTGKSHYTGGWSGHNLSSWLPLIKA